LGEFKPNKQGTYHQENWVYWLMNIVHLVHQEQWGAKARGKKRSDWQQIAHQSTSIVMIFQKKTKNWGRAQVKIRPRWRVQRAGTWAQSG
jgi:hypothetical protein